MPLATSRWIANGHSWSIYSGVRQAVPELFPGGHISAGSEADATLRSFNELLNERSRRMRRMRGESERFERCSEEAEGLNEHLAPLATTKEI